MVFEIGSIRFPREAIVSEKETGQFQHAFFAQVNNMDS